MATVTRVCRKCGTKIFSDAPEGLCTGCVLETALGMFPDAVAAGDDCGSAKEVAAKEATQSKTAARAANVLGVLSDHEMLEEVGRGGQGGVVRAMQNTLNLIGRFQVDVHGQ